MRFFLQVVMVCLSVGVGESACPHLEAGLEKWGDTTSWKSGVLPKEGDNLLIPSGKKLLLNVSPPCLSSITIEAGAALVWGDVDNLNVCVSYILIRGRLQIGSEDCRFTRKTHIRLIGESNSTLSVSGFGRKFIGVAAGGTIEVHGEEKPSWTKLIQTAKPGACDSLFDFQKSVFQAESARGLYVSVFNEDSSLWDFAVFRTGEDIADEDLQFQEFIEGIPQDKILAVALQGELGSGDMAAVYETLETAGGLTSSAIRNVTGRQAYAFITRTGHSDTTTERHVLIPRHIEIAETGYLAVDVNGFQFSVNSKVFSNTNIRKGVDFRVLPAETAYPCLKLNAEVSTWRPGDKIVIASTDFDWRQAEEMTIKSCPSCAVNEICLTEPLEYMHYGEVTLGVDERAEVGLLSRNILIEGVIPENGCSVNEPEDQYLCDLFGFDTFGGHIKVVRGFTAAHIQGVELYHMGQQRFVGTYPLHFHMCDDVDGNWFRHNSIHHSLTRCVTVHGSDGAEVSDNVCYLHHGHGFFLEDSSEQRNVFDSNLCIGTMHGTHIMSDMKKEWCNATMKEFCDAVSSYWITHPNNTFINNVAAGSDHAGFWILASRLPLGPSRQRQQQRGLVPEFHAMQTKVKEFRNNTAHSNMNRGLRIDRRISHGEYRDKVYIPENGVLGAQVSHTPMTTPTDTGGPFDKSYLYEFTAYKNRGHNVWTKAGIVIMSNFTLADAAQGITMAAASTGTYAKLTNSMLVGETENLGLPQEPFGRSRSGIADEPLQGVVFYQGPGHVTNTFFDKYETITSDQNITRYAGAISVKRSNPYPPKASSHVDGIKFGFCDVNEGNWAYKGDPSVPLMRNRDGNRQITFRDIDGSVSGMAGTQFVPNTRFHTTNQCDYRPVSNFAVCPHDYAKAVFSGDGALKTLKENYPMYMRRDDRPDDPFALQGTKGNAYLVIKKKPYTVYFNGTAPTKLKVAGQNLERGDYVRLGLCYPKDVTSFSFSSGLPKIGAATPAISVSSISDLDRDTTGRAYFWDKSTGLLFIKIYSNVDRVDGERCPGYKCPSIIITRTGGSNDLADCYHDAYDGTYNQPEDNAVNIPKAKPCVKTKSKAFGAEVEANFFSARPSTPVCPSDPVHQGRSNPELRGCFKDSSYRDLPYALLELPLSMTVSFCVERCYYRGYVYAALQNGNECRCGNMYGGFGNSTMCSKSCSGDNTVNCGGSLANAVYTTGNAVSPAMITCGPGDNGTVIDGKCYYLTSGSFSYVEAQRQCVQYGGDLATIISGTVQFEVERYMRPFKTDAWFGLNDVARDGTYAFIDGTTLGSYSNFIKKKAMSSNPDFGVLKANSLYRWGVREDGSYPALCQLPVLVTTPVRCGQNNHGQQLQGGDCYHVINTALDYTMARYACHTRRGTLAYVSTPRELAAVTEHIFRFGGAMDYWIAEEGGDIIELDHALIYNKKKANEGTKNGVVCSIESLSAARPCSTDWLHNDGKCYLYSGDRGDYDKTKLFCNQGDSQVLTVLSDAENTFVGDTVKTETLNPQVHIGYVYNNATSAYEWEDGSYSSYTNWDNMQGEDNVAKGSCVVLKSHNSKWRNTKCSKIGAIMCKSRAA